VKSDENSSETRTTTQCNKILQSKRGDNLGLTATHDRRCCRNKNGLRGNTILLGEKFKNHYTETVVQTRKET
jgi:hypothetical protein